MSLPKWTGARARRIFLAVLVAAGCALSIFVYERTTVAADVKKSQLMLAHNVYFVLKDNSAARQQELIDGCKEFLVGHPGTAYFAAGKLADLSREVNDRNFDVALVLVFNTRADHDRYQDAPRHNEFVAKFKSNWSKVRVFDADVEGAP